MQYYCDNARHLVCVPYSVENLHKMAAALDIKRCWYHNGSYHCYERAQFQCHLRFDYDISICIITITKCIIIIDVSIGIIIIIIISDVSNNVANHL